MSGRHDTDLWEGGGRRGKGEEQIVIDHRYEHSTAVQESRHLSLSGVQRTQLNSNKRVCSVSIS